jgi:hypothetical protein
MCLCREFKALSKNHNLMKKLEKKWWVSRRQVSKKIEKLPYGLMDKTFFSKRPLEMH